MLAGSTIGGFDNCANQRALIQEWPYTEFRTTLCKTNKTCLRAPSGLQVYIL